MVDARNFESGETNTRAASVLECSNVIDPAPIIHIYVFLYVCMCVYMYECMYVFTHSGRYRFVEYTYEENKNVKKLEIFSLPMDLVALTDR